MKIKLLKTILVAIISVYCSVSVSIGASKERLFIPDKNVPVRILVEGNTLMVDITSKSKTLSKTITIETEKILHVSIDDYNFDGYKDFSVWHFDDGMGTYTIFEVYLYSNKEIDFARLKPRCGEEFLNLRVFRSKRLLKHSYIVNNRYLTCVTKF